jgi:catechol 2,3-dioxygenase-like lactoylglutathione lyase family enzyme
MIAGIDHLVLTVRSLDATCAFYERTLGMRRESAPGRPTALHFGRQKINLHEAGHTFEPKARTPTPGSADFCLVADGPLDEVRNRLAALGIAVELGPVARDGARGPMTSIYFRDPDQNLVEVCAYDRGGAG